MNAEKKLNATSTRKAAPLRTAAVITLYGEDMKSAGKALSFFKKCFRIDGFEMFKYLNGTKNPGHSFKWLKVNWDKGKI